METLFTGNTHGRVQGCVGKQCVVMGAKAEGALEKMSYARELCLLVSVFALSSTGKTLHRSFFIDV
jgi:hypothetical protein